MSAKKKAARNTRKATKFSSKHGGITRSAYAKEKRILRVKAKAAKAKHKADKFKTKHEGLSRVEWKRQEQKLHPRKRKSQAIPQSTVQKFLKEAVTIYQANPTQ